MADEMLVTRPVPKVGLLTNSIGAFNPDAKDSSEKRIRAYFDGLVRDGKVSRDSVVIGRIFGPHEVVEAADRFARECVDLVVIANVGFPNGQVFLTLATNPYLARIPIATIGEPEPEGDEWYTNAWCGVLMNNFVAKQLGRHIAAIPGKFDSPEFDEEFQRLLRVAGTIKALRKEFICRFGDAPGGFHSATGDQIAFAKVFGTRVDTVDLSAVVDAMNTGGASGYLGESRFTDADVRATMDQIKAGREVQVDDVMLEKGCRLYHAFRSFIQANGYTSASFRCWPETNEAYIGISHCLAMGLLLANGDITAAACEGDWPTAVVQTMGAALSGSAACLDWVNYTGGSEIVQLGHCGMGICGKMAAGCEAIAVHPVIRQAGAVMGPVHTGQFEYGPKTGICIRQDPDGRFELLAFTGESGPDTAKGLKYAAADVRVKNYKQLNKLILDHGFPHHLAVAMGDVVEDLGMLCGFLGVDFYTPEG